MKGCKQKAVPAGVWNDKSSAKRVLAPLELWIQVPSSEPMPQDTDFILRRYRKMKKKA
jgi:hypothetical protein